MELDLLEILEPVELGTLATRGAAVAAGLVDILGVMSIAT